MCNPSLNEGLKHSANTVRRTKEFRTNVKSNMTFLYAWLINFQWWAGGECITGCVFPLCLRLLRKQFDGDFLCLKFVRFTGLALLLYLVVNYADFHSFP